MRRYSTLWNISIQKSHRPTAQERRPKCTLTEENVTVADLREPVLSQGKPQFHRSMPDILYTSLYTAKSLLSWSEVLMICCAQKLTKQTAISRLGTQNSCQKIFSRWCYFHLVHGQKGVYSIHSKNSRIANCTHLLQKRRMYVTFVSRWCPRQACQSWATSVWYLLIRESRSIEHVIMRCFCQQLLLLAVYQASGKFIFQQHSSPAYRGLYFTRWCSDTFEVWWYFCCQFSAGCGNEFF